MVDIFNYICLEMSLNFLLKAEIQDTFHPFWELLIKLAFVCGHVQPLNTMLLWNSPSNFGLDLAVCAYRLMRCAGASRGWRRLRRANGQRAT